MARDPNNHGGDISQNPSPLTLIGHCRISQKNTGITVSHVVVSDGRGLVSGIGLVIPGDVLFAPAPCTWALVGSLDAFLAGAHAIDGADALYSPRRD